MTRLTAIRCIRADRRVPGRFWRPGLVTAALVQAGSGQATDVGPFTLNGFVQAGFSRLPDSCPESARFPDENKQRFWADELAPDTAHGRRELHVALAQPYLDVQFGLPGIFKLTGLVGRHGHDGDEHVPGFWHDKNVALSPED